MFRGKCVARREALEEESGKGIRGTTGTRGEDDLAAADSTASLFSLASAEVNDAACAFRCNALGKGGGAFEGE